MIFSQNPDLTPEDLDALLAPVETTPGDYNADGLVDTADIDLQAMAMQEANPDLGTFDENADGLVNDADRIIWVQDHAKTWFGDANFDGSFSTDDLVAVFAAGKYETTQPAIWSEGDWTGDLVFDSGDLVAAFSDGGFELGPRPRGCGLCRPRTHSCGDCLAGIGRHRRIGASPRGASRDSTSQPRVSTRRFTMESERRLAIKKRPPASSDAGGRFLVGSSTAHEALCQEGPGSSDRKPFFRGWAFFPERLRPLLRRWQGLPR